MQFQFGVFSTSKGYWDITRWKVEERLYHVSWQSFHNVQIQEGGREGGKKAGMEKEFTVADQ